MSNGHKAKVKFLQLPIVPATVTTTHKAQGLTLDGLHVTEIVAHPGVLYTALSRVRRLDSLYLPRALTAEDVAACALDPMLADHVAHLSRLESATTDAVLGNETARLELFKQVGVFPPKKARKT